MLYPIAHYMLMKHLRNFKSDREEMDIYISLHLVLGYKGVREQSDKTYRKHLLKSLSSAVARPPAIYLKGYGPMGSVSDVRVILVKPP